MNELKLFSFGQSKHLNAIKKKYAILKNKITEDSSLTEGEKSTKLKQLEKSFEKENKNLNQNLY